MIARIKLDNFRLLPSLWIKTRLRRGRGEGQVAKFECLVTQCNGHHGRQCLNVKEANLLFGFRPSLDLKWGPQRNTKKKTRTETEKRGETGNENTVKERVIKIVTKTRIKKGGEGMTEQKRSEVIQQRTVKE